jgi:hypothetical protein
VLAGLFVPFQGVQPLKGAAVFKNLLILVMPILGLHIELDELEDEATP